MKIVRVACWQIQEQPIHGSASMPSLTKGWHISEPPIQARQLPRTIYSITSMACCIPRTTAAAMPITCQRNCPAFRPSRTDAGMGQNQAADFWAFVAAGRKLGDLHCDYESVEPYPVVFSRGDTSLVAPADPISFYRVEKMKFAGKRPNLDKTTLIYNSNITITGIPLDAYEYVVNGKPALEWVMERQCVKTDKDSGIVNDANRYAIETAGDPAYPLKLFQRVITVSLETMKIVKALPPLGDLS